MGIAMDSASSEPETKCPRLQSVLKYLMVLLAAVLVAASAWMERFSFRKLLMAVSGGLLSVCCLVFAFLNYDQLKNRKKEL
jgi:general stress protein CsbA